MKGLEHTYKLTVYAPVNVKVIQIRRRDWDHIRSSVPKVVPTAFNFDSAGWGCAGATVSGVLAILALAATEGVPSNIWIAAWSLTIALGFLSIAFFIMSHIMVGHMTVAAQNICDFMDDVLKEITDAMDADVGEDSSEPIVNLWLSGDPGNGSR